MSDKVFYKSLELLEIFKEQHRLCSPLDPVADETFILTRETTISKLREAQDLVAHLSESLLKQLQVGIQQARMQHPPVP
jgi:uncharacterized protein YbaP (TraB family)